jgi:hypothetical protein
MKRDVLRFVAQSERTDFFQDRIARSTSEQPIVCGADEFGDDQNLNLEVQSEETTHEPKQKVRPMHLNQ